MDTSKRKQDSESALKTPLTDRPTAEADLAVDLSTPVVAEGGKKLRLEILHRGDPPPCLRRVVQCRGCNGWKAMLKGAREIPLWRRYPFGCPWTGLTVRFVVDKSD